MACIKSAARSALVAVAPEAAYLAAGTMAGAVDLSFSSSAHLEIFRVDFASDSPDLPVAAKLPSPDRFNRLSWSKPSLALPLGLVAGGLADGTIAVWNPATMIKTPDLTGEDGNGALVARLEKHNGSVRGLEFCTLSPNLLSSGADDGELCIWDLANPAEPTLFPSLKSVGSASQTEVSYISWNPKFQHIIASTSYNGMTVVWDLRSQKPVTSFSDPTRRRCSVLQWNPDVSTQLIIASDDDSSPSLKVWDVRKTISPSREFVGHSKGVIAMSWCPYDGSLLLTCAKDNRTICWDTYSGEIVSELPASTNWNFDIHWYPKIPGVISASSFDMKIGLYNLEACGRQTAGEGTFGVQARLRAPKWLKCPTGASFGFGGKFVSFHQNLSVPSTPQAQSAASGSLSSSSDVFVHNIVIEESLVKRSAEFEAAVHNGDRASLRALCDKNSQEALSEEDRETWGFLKILFEDDAAAKMKLITHLGYSLPEDTKTKTDELTGSFPHALQFQNGGRDESAVSRFLVDDGEDFFNNPQPSDAIVAEENSAVEKVNERTVEQPISSDPSIDEHVQRALVVGDYAGAVSQCLAANRVADALVIAHVGGSSLWESTRNHCLSNSVSPYLKVVSALVHNDLMTLVSTWPVHAWKETLALLCTFAPKDEWNVLCDTLASRLLTVGNTLAATLCYICAGNIDRTVEIWSRHLKSDDGGRTYVDLLQDLIEKTTVLALGTGHKHFSASLSKLVETYAELLASQGGLKTAMEYLKLLGSEGSSNELEILQKRIALSVESEHRVVGYNVTPIGASTYGADSINAQQHHAMSGTPYGDGYHQQHAYSGYQPAQPKQQPHVDYSNSSQFQPSHPASTFVPQQILQPQQPSFVSQPPPQAPVSFTPTNTPGLKNATHYQQPTLGSQLYPQGVVNNPYQPVPPVPVSHPVNPTPPAPKFQPAPFSNPSARFTPPPQAVVQRPGLSPVEPSSPTLPVQPVAAPPAPPPTIQTVDTSNVPDELRPVVTTLTRLYDETSSVLGGPQANLVKKREMEDNSKRIGELFFKLNSRDVSPNVSTKLLELCQALNSGNFPAAVQIQVLLTTSDWDECQHWITALKRMIKLRQTLR